MKDPDCKDWTAVYLPARSDGQDITKSGFKSIVSAKRYTHRWYCKSCRHKLAVALYWERKYGIKAYEASKAVYKTLKAMVTKKSMVKKLLPLLNKFAKTGELK